MTTTTGAAAQSEADQRITATVRALRSAHRTDTQTLMARLDLSSKQSLYNRLNGSVPWLAREIYALSAMWGCTVQSIYDGQVSINPLAVTPSVNKEQNKVACSPLRRLTLISSAQVTRTGHRTPIAPAATRGRRHACVGVTRTGVAWMGDDRAAA